MPETLSPRAIARYNRLAVQVVAFKHALDRQKPGPVSLSTVLALNRLVELANRVYAREPERHKFHGLLLAEPYNTGDLAIALTPLVLAGINFEDRHASQQAAR